MIDTHAHLADKSFDEDLEEVIAKARIAGVCGCVVVSEHPQESDRVREIKRRWPHWAKAGLGLFPGSFVEADVLHFGNLAQSASWDCIGEVGLDTWIVEDNRLRGWHEEVFHYVVQTAQRLDLPLNVHSRNTGRRVVEILREVGAKKVHLHAFDAKGSTIDLGIEAGYYFSIPASVIHSPQKQKLAKRVPLKQLLIETDSPVLGLDRSMRNEPMNARIALEETARIRGISALELEEITDENARRLYGFSI